MRGDGDLTWAVYRRMVDALKEGRGVRISAEELRAMYEHDAAIMGVIENLREERDREREGR